LELEDEALGLIELGEHLLCQRKTGGGLEKSSCKPVER
jgi:hypothetical protein